MQINYPEKITVVVTPEDIQRGFRCSSSACPIALALYRLFPNHIIGIRRDNIVALIGVRGNIVALNEQIRYNTSKRARAFIYKFDNKLVKYKYGVELKTYKFIFMRVN